MSHHLRPYAGGSVPENYERHLVPLLFLDYAADLAARVDVPAGGAVLETACGTGAVTRHLLARLPVDARLTATDLAPPMVDQARQVVGDHPALEYRQADATDLPFADAAFDAVVCQFALMLFPDRVQAMREAARVLKRGGHFVFNVWDALEHNGLSRAVHEAVAQVFTDDPPRFLEVPYCYHDLSAIVQALQQAGFATIDITVQPRESRASGPHHVAMAIVAGSALANQIAERGSPPLEEVVAAVEDAMARRFGSGAISAPMQAFQIFARLPD
jgi:ubiquinone/menaquinone biosynthesis C-methylase UbiE